MAPHIRTVRTASGARAVQIVYSNRKGTRDIRHIGSAHDDVELELLKTVARQTLAGGQDELDLGLQRAVEAGGPFANHVVADGSPVGRVEQLFRCPRARCGLGR